VTIIDNQTPANANNSDVIGFPYTQPS